MDSFRIQNSSDNHCSQSFIFSPDDLADIPHPDDLCEKENSPLEDTIELPPPPGTSGEDFPMPLPHRPQPKINPDTLSPLPHGEGLGNSSSVDLVLMSESFNILPLSEDCQQKSDLGTDELVHKPMDVVDEAKYSPSKVDSDEENTDCVMTKPKVLGKEQAKKRLMAFSLSKLPSASVKKKSLAITPAKNKEKPPNPNKGSNIQEQLRATMSAIEEEKKKMFQTMPNYYLQEMSDPVKLHSSSSSSSMQNPEKLKSDKSNSKNGGSSGRDGGSSKSNENRGKRVSRRSRSRSSSRYKSKRRRRSRSEERSRSRSKRRSSSRSRRNGSHSVRPREDKNYKSNEKNSRDSWKKPGEDWNKNKPPRAENDSKNPSDENKLRRDEQNRRSPTNRTEFKPIFNYLSKGCSPMAALQARPADPSNPGPVLFPEKTVKFTRTKPTIPWSENPSHATEFYMSKQMLLENCDDATSSILLSIMENKSVDPSEGEYECQQSKSRPWYPRENHSLTGGNNEPEASENRSCEPSDEGERRKVWDSVKEEAIKRRASLERKISLVNDGYLSEEEEQEEGETGAVGKRGEVDAEASRGKVRSKWDSDCEGESGGGKRGSGDARALRSDGAPEGVVEGFGGRGEWKEKKRSAEPSNWKPSDAGTGNLVSEYEEFLKMVSVESNDAGESQREKGNAESSGVEKPKMKRGEKSSEESRRSPKLGLTDWDEESDHEEKSKKVQLGGAEARDEFSVLKGEKSEVKSEGKKKKKGSKKGEKGKGGKKSEKGRKKKHEKSGSEESSSESESSESESSDSSKERRKKKHSKSRKRHRGESSSESESDSEDGKTKKKKWKQKKGGKGKKSGSSDSDEVQNVLLKQLDLKKHLIMKKIEEMDSVGEKGSKRKQKESKGKKKEGGSSEESDSEKRRKSGKKKKSDGKGEKERKKSKNGSKRSKQSGKGKRGKKSKSSSESESETSEEESKKKKLKKSERRKKDTSDESESGEKEKKSSKSKTGSKSQKKSKKSRKESSSSESESEGSSKSREKERKKKSDGKSGNEKLSEGAEMGLSESLLLEDSGVKCGGKPLAWGRKKVWKKVGGERKKRRKEGDDWEASSSAEESEKESKTRESSWDDEILPREAKAQVPEEDMSKVDSKLSGKADCQSFDLSNPLPSGNLKSSLSVFSFNENSFCSFGQELSRDFFLTEVSFSNSGNFAGNENSKMSTMESRPFQSVSKDAEGKKTAHSELYSPGHSDSEASEGEGKQPGKPPGGSTAETKGKEDVYDPLNCDSEGSAENNRPEAKSVPLPRVSDILLPGEGRAFESLSSHADGGVLKDLAHNDSDKFDIMLPSMSSPLKSNLSLGDFTPVRLESPFSDDPKGTPSKKQLMSVKGQTKLMSKAASVFRDESDEENIEPTGKGKGGEGSEKEAGGGQREKASGEGRNREGDVDSAEENSRGEGKRSRERSREGSAERRGGRRRRSRSREKRSSSKGRGKRGGSPGREKEARGKREIRSDSFEIEPLKSCIDSNELTDLVQPIPVLTGLETSTDGLWSRSLIPGCEFPHSSDNLIDNAESFDIYPSEESTYRGKNYETEFSDHDKAFEKSKDQRSRREKRKSRSRSQSPRKKVKSKSPERRRSPRRRSSSPKRKEKSPFSPRRRSPKKKSPSRKYKNSRSPDKRRKSRSRSPRKRRASPSRRSRSLSPRKYKSPKYPDESPKRRDPSATAFSPRERFSPRKDPSYPPAYPKSLQNRIPVIGAAIEDADMELSPSAVRSPMFENPARYPRHMADRSAHDPDLYNSFYEGEYTEEFRMGSYPEEVSANNLITVKNHDLEKTGSSERLSLDQRIELELGATMPGGAQAQSEQYQVCPQFQDASYFQNSCSCDNANGDNFYQNQTVAINDFNGQYFNGHQHQSGYRSFQQYPNSQAVQNSVMQVGNIVEVVPTAQHPSAMSSKPAPQIMQIGNVLQVVPSQKPGPHLAPQAYPEDSSGVKIQKATAVVAPSSVAPAPNPETILNPLIKAIQLEREKRKKEKEKRKVEREARRKARQLRREAKLMLVNEKLKKSVENEGLMLGQEVEDDELLDALDVPSPPIPVEIITVSSPNALPPAGKGILITAGFVPKPPSEKKEVKFADGICPGEGTSTSGGEEIASPPPKPKLPKEKRFKKRKTKVKKKVKVQIIRQILQEEEEEDEDNLSPPPPPPGDPPPVFFARFPFAGEAQFPVYQTETTTTTLTTVQYVNQSFE